ncbi:hypothetical protein [Rickettsiella grylli]|uniref:Uncharacterized protein n=2 Tax=Rickettsiella grylli TaxID=59196 RepID=A8PLI5_9COXI|nr:hypothetical protein [Rickettsiella grylli]EDP46903.1 hypothetical protein RICGR_0438 [Rickettsiella grylli]OJA00398.1 hypothetical protein BEV13_03765 [Rickettsiella grylli]
MAIVPSQTELDAAFETARQLKEKIEMHAYSRKCTHVQKIETQKKITAFIVSNRKIINRCIENKNTTSDILLAQVMKQFYEIKKLIGPEPRQQTGIFFRKQPHQSITSIKELKIRLKRIDEIFNMLSQETLQPTTSRAMRT